MRCYQIMRNLLQTSKYFFPEYFEKGKSVFNYRSVKQPANEKKFDVVISSDLIGNAYDLQPGFTNIKTLLKANGTLIITSINPFWGGLFGNSYSKNPPVFLWFIENLADISGFRIIKSGYKILPSNIPALDGFLNLIFAEIPKFKRLLPFQYVIAKPKKINRAKNYSISIIIPVFNEEDNIADCIKQIPKLGKFTQTIIVDDGSTDRTLEIARSYQKKFKNLYILSLKSNEGKARAVKKGFDAATGDILMIWDADRTVPADELVRFYNLMATGQAEYTHGTRLAYPMEKQAMKFANLAGNLFFGWFYSLILNTQITDTLCGTKVMFKKDYKKIKMGTEPWGDFDLLFGAKRLGLVIKEIPIHYKARTAGLSKMKTFRYGFIVAKMSLKAFWEFKILPFLKI